MLQRSLQQSSQKIRSKHVICDVVFCQALQIFEDIIRDEHRNCFHKRFEEYYIIEANDDKSKLCKFYRAIKLKITGAEAFNEEVDDVCMVDELSTQTFSTPDPS